MEYDQDAFAKLCSSKLTGRDRIYASNRKDGETVIYELIFQSGSKRHVYECGRLLDDRDVPGIVSLFNSWKARYGNPRENWVEFEEYEDGLIGD